jgi:hypothetical protein
MLYEFLKINSHFSNHRNSVRLQRFYNKAFMALKIEEIIQIVVPVKTYPNPKTCQHAKSHFILQF